MESYKLKDFAVIEYNKKPTEERKIKDVESLSLRPDKSIKCFIRYRTKSGKFITEIYNI